LTVLHDVYSSPEEEPILGAEVGVAIDRGAASSVLFVTRNADRSTWQLDRLREVLRRVGKKEGPPQPQPQPPSRCRVVVLASCGPYDLLLGGTGPGFGEEEGLGLDEVGYVASFEFTPEALDAAAAVIFGEEEARGRAPVCGGNIFP
jgi:beta-N-acetylhexosaminidase